MALHFTLDLGRRKWNLHIIRRFSTLKTNMPEVTTKLHSANRKICELIRNGQLEDARAFFNGMSDKNTVTWNSMLRGYVLNRAIADARKFFDEIPQKDVVSWNSMLSGYVSCHHLEEARYLFDNMPEQDTVSWNTMISGYTKNGRIDDAFMLFRRTPEKNVVTWNAMITGFMDNGYVLKASELFRKMPRRDAASISAFVSGLIKNNDLDEAEKVLFEYRKTCPVKEDLINAYNTLIAGYGQKGRVEDARRIFNEIPMAGGNRKNRMSAKNIISWNSMIMSYEKAGDMTSAAELFDQMEDRDTVSWNTMIRGYVNVSDMDAAIKLFSVMPNPDTLSWNSIISGFAQTGQMERALDFFERMPQRDLVSWNTMIAGFEKNAGFVEAVHLFVNMQAEGEKPDKHTLSSLLSICSESAAQRLGMQIHQMVVKTVVPDIPLNNSLITMYARCGAITEARTVFDNALQKDVISWNAMIGGYATHDAKVALELFESMKLFRVAPTYITFISVLSACAHGGLVEEGRSYFRSMTCDFGIEPRVEHFASLVDIVGRSGKVEEAMDIINHMPLKPDQAVWGALLGACRLHNVVELASVAAGALMRLEPESSGPYVLLRNTHVDAGKWNDADRIRMMMEKNCIKKEGGYSSVDMGCS